MSYTTAEEEKSISKYILLSHTYELKCTKERKVNCLRLLHRKTIKVEEIRVRFKCACACPFWGAKIIANDWIEAIVGSERVASRDRQPTLVNVKGAWVPGNINSLRNVWQQNTKLCAKRDIGISLNWTGRPRTSAWSQTPGSNFQWKDQVIPGRNAKH